jgi:glyoxylase-like metal-dependent hydrolase (beta-lactamase superfamily II)
MRFPKAPWWKFLPTIVAAGAILPHFLPAQNRPAAPRSPRLYVVDCGELKGLNVTIFGFKEGEVPSRDLVVSCYLVAHPRGSLIFDVGVIPDSQLKAGGPTTEGKSTVSKSLRSRLAEIGYSPADVTYLAMSHYHSDHTANANLFAGSTWLVRKGDYDVMMDEKSKGIIQRAHFSDLKNTNTTIINTKDYDVFGDGAVVLKAAEGHTQGHQVLFVNLPKTGPILIVGDLYHLPEERAMNRFPSFEVDKEQAARSRREIDEFLARTKAQMWIVHDAATHAKLKKSPAYYE